MVHRRKKLTGWKKTGICPSCKGRSVTVGNCLKCGWVSVEQKRKRRKPARRRVRRSSMTSGLRKCRRCHKNVRGGAAGMQKHHRKHHS